jgi:quercetin dioxygenase-like cupin family protein
MTEEADDPSLTPETLEYTHLPEQTMYKIRTEDAASFDQGGEDIQTYPLCITNEFKLLYFEMDPGATIDWHTHVPSFDEVCLCLGGRARYTLQREDDSHQVIEIDRMEFVYVPGGARHKIEAVGDQRHEGLVAMPSNPVARVEMLEGEAPYRIEDWPVALWVDRQRDEVVERDEAAVSR